MTGYVLVYGRCCACNQPFSFNPHKVPSIQVDGVREPVCQHCMLQANRIRVQQGLPRHPIDPEAYEPMSEAEL